MSHQDVRQMEMRMNNHDQSLEFSDENDDDQIAWQSPINYLEDKSANPENNLVEMNFEDQQTKKLYSAMESLDERSKIIIQQRWLNAEKSTLETLAQQFSISLERIRQLEKNAMQKMRLAISESTQ